MERLLRYQTRASRFVQLLLLLRCLQKKSGKQFLFRSQVAGVHTKLRFPKFLGAFFKKRKRKPDDGNS